MANWRRMNMRLVSLEDNLWPAVDRIVSVLLALTPILQHYRAPIYNAALTVMVVFVPYLLFRTICKLRNYRHADLSVVAITILYLVYRVVDHGTSITELGQSCVLIVYLVSVAFHAIDTKAFYKTGLFIAVLASILLLLQYICFYVLGFHLQLVPTDLLLPSADQWVLGAQTGLAGITGKIRTFYRPSAFFLEPSHTYIYLFPYLFIQLFGSKDRCSMYSALLITLGLVLCTSGMGMAAAFGAWGVFLILRNEADGTFSVRNIGRKRNLMMLVCLMVLFALSAAFVPPVRRTVSRIFISNEGSNAISGRLAKALRLLKDMSFQQWILGVEDTTHDISFNMPGLVATLYRYGLLGMIMSIDIYIMSVFKLKLPFAFTGGVILVTSLFSAHTHSTVGMLYYILILMHGVKTQRRESGWFIKNKQK